MSREQVREQETHELIERNYGGSADLLVAPSLGRKNLSNDKLFYLKQMIDELE